MPKTKRDFRNDRSRHDRYEQPRPLYLPIPEPPLDDPHPRKRQDEEKTERGIWIIDI